MRTDERSVIVSYELPELEHQAIERIARARGAEHGAIVGEAMQACLRAGGPHPRTAPWRVPLAGDDFEVYRIVVWWLRQDEARKILAPARLAQEAWDAAGLGDVAATRAALLQLRRIYGDLEHPDCIEAKNLCLEMIPEPLRSQLRDDFDRAVLGAAQRRDAQGVKA